MKAVSRSVHLAKRFIFSLNRSALDSAHKTWVKNYLLPSEYILWTRLANFDQRHAVQVAQRFVKMYPVANRDQIAAALLHDIGKLTSDLGRVMRVIATITGPRTRRFGTYFEHEAEGLRLCREAGSAEQTLVLLAGLEESQARSFLVAADNI